MQNASKVAPESASAPPSPASSSGLSPTPWPSSPNHFLVLLVVFTDFFAAALAVVFRAAGDLAEVFRAAAFAGPFTIRLLGLTMQSASPTTSPRGDYHFGASRTNRLSSNHEGKLPPPPLSPGLRAGAASDRAATTEWCFCPADRHFAEVILLGFSSARGQFTCTRLTAFAEAP